MKKIINQSLFLMGLILLATACKKDENKVVFEGTDAPIVLSSTAPATLVLKITDKANTAINFSWNNPGFKFNTGVSSQDVTYTLQIDTTNSNFTNPKIQEKSVAKELATSLTVGELNSLLLNMNLQFGVSHNIEMRIKAALSNNAVPVYSNVLKYTITPYLDVKYPVPTNLYITGSATPVGWQCACGEAPVTTQQFTKVNDYTFELTLALSANNEYLLLPVYADWGAKYGFTGDGGTNNVLGDSFKPSGNNIKAPTVSGNYKITVDFKTGSFSLVKV
jgi:hypothetical protein